MENSIIAVTMGDPAGIGPELCLRLLAGEGRFSDCVPVVYGDWDSLMACARKSGLPEPPEPIQHEDWTADRAPRPTHPTLINYRVTRPGQLRPGVFSAATGRMAICFIESAIQDLRAGRVDAVTCGPIQKDALSLAGVNFPGHTELFEARLSHGPTCMMQYSNKLVCSYATMHVGYADVPLLLSRERVRDVIRLTRSAMRGLLDREPKLVVCGLNPHAGEHGLFGAGEEEKFIIPAIEDARAEGARIAGPVPADTAFIPSMRAKTDAYICMYHDQGHIPVKALACGESANTTLGLPYVRTSVNHGTAMNLAWQGVAHPGSLFSAVSLASRMLTPKACRLPRTVQMSVV